MTTPEDDELVPEMREFRRRLADGYAAHPPLDSVPIAAARTIVDAVRAPLAQGGPAMAQTTELILPLHGQPAVRLRVHRPSAEPAALPALVYLHGGGWIYFSLDSHDRLMREYAARAGRVVIGVDYARAPEARFPVALEQTLGVLRWLRASGDELQIDPARIVAGGDSAGANLALAAALALRDAGDMLLQGLLLNYGAFGDDDASESFERYDGPLYTLGREEMRGFWRSYLRSEEDRFHPLAQPLRGRLSELPPALLVVADCDLLRDSSLQLAARLAAAGNPPTVRRYAGAPHSFLEAMSFAELSRQALDDSAAWLKRLPLRAGA